MNIVAIVWSSQAPPLLEAAARMDGLKLQLFSSKQLVREPQQVDRALSAAMKADLIFMYRTSDGFWTDIDASLADRQDAPPVVCLSHDPSLWAQSTVSLPTVQACSDYLTHGGSDNAEGMWRYLAREVLNRPLEVPPPRPLPWEGFYHPAAPIRHFATITDYLAWYDGYAADRGLGIAPAAGILFTRSYWVNHQLAVENALIDALETQGMRVIPVFSYSSRDDSLGSRGSAAVVREAFLDGQRSRIDILIKLQAFFLGRSRGEDPADTDRSVDGVELLRALDVPVLQPVVAFGKTIAEWEHSGDGLGRDVGWTVALPEFEGVIEPLLIGAMSRNSDSDTETEERQPVPERLQRLARRVARWVRLRRTPVHQRKVAFVLHSDPCASEEATVGSGAGLDALESLARLLHQMAADGYRVNPPKSGEELAQMILDRKAIGEFRWTTIEEIVAKGGALARIPVERYRQWWDRFPESVRERMRDAWGEPPGEAVAGMPAAMVHEDRIIVTGLDLGNIRVCVQPKRGCAGSRCDGEVCKILHDPDVPPPHQFVATYRWLQDDFDADVIVHVGTHGTLEFLPGKSTGLSSACLPDICLGDLPHLYIYNADNPAEGVIAKRRSHATLVDHMQTVLVQSGLYDDLEEIDRSLGEWEQARQTDPHRAHVLEHILEGLLKESGVGDQLGMEDWTRAEFTDLARATHDFLGRLRNSQMQDGLHILGDLPQDQHRIDMLHAILRHDAGEALSPRRLATRLWGLNLSALLSDPGAVDERLCASHGRLLQEAEELSRSLVGLCLNLPVSELTTAARDLAGPRLVDDRPLGDLPALQQRVQELAGRLDASTEDKALLHGLNGGYIAPGPSGLLFRGRDDILPTGRNLFALDPERVPTRAAAVIGRNLAQGLLDKHLREEGRLPENVGIYWMCGDLMWSDGEGLAQMMTLLGVEPEWLPNGRVRDFRVTPLSELGRPRIDLTLRVSGITRDNFPDRIALLDRAIQTVAALDEPEELNYVRKHSLAQLRANGGDPEDGDALRRASRRIFSAAPGTYRAGVNLAVYASAWKDAADLSDIFVFWNGYAYGDGVFGEASHTELAHSLSTVEVTFNKIVNDAHDLFGCCGYFGNHGGLSAAAGTLSGKAVRNYYGDTREAEAVAVVNLADEIRRVARTKLLNPRWIEGMKRHGYKGAGDIAKRVGRLYGWEAATQEVDDRLFDDVVRTFVQNEENRRFFEEHNPWAMEEIGRRLLEAEARGLWQADPQLLAELRQRYLDAEGWIEERTGDIEGDFQGGAIDILTSDDVTGWGEAMKEVKALTENLRKATQ